MKFHVLKPDFDNDEMVRFYASKENFDKRTVKMFYMRQEKRCGNLAFI